MLRWNGLLGLAGMIAVTGLATATTEPPSSPQVEGREPNPVVREFHESEKPVESYGIGRVVPGRSYSEQQTESAVWDAVVLELWDVLLDRLTVPLGTAPMGERGSSET